MLMVVALVSPRYMRWARAEAWYSLSPMFMRLYLTWLTLGSIVFLYVSRLSICLHKFINKKLTISK